MAKIPGEASLRAKILLALSCFFGTIVLIEGSARLFMDPPPFNSLPGLSPNEMEHDHLLWHHRPGFIDHEGSDNGPINSHGFRGPEISTAKPVGRFRILSLGESTSYGDSIDWHQTYAHVLEQTLKDEGVNAEAINAGVRGWSTFQSAQLLALRIDDLQPDLVLVYHEVNDFLPTSFRGLQVSGAGMNDIEMLKFLQHRSYAKWLIEHSRFLSGWRVKLARNRASATERLVADLAKKDVLVMPSLPYKTLPGTIDDEKPWMDNPSQLVRLPDPQRQQVLESIVDLTRSRKVQLILLHPTYPVSKPHRCILTRVATDFKVPMIDIETLLRADAMPFGRRKSDYFRQGDKFHPNVLGHATIGRGISDFIIENNMIPPKSRLESTKAGKD